MRISERKRQLREQADSVARGGEAPRERVERPARTAASRPTSTRQSARAATKRTSTGRVAAAPPRRTRGPRFYAGFGIVGLIFSLILIQSTISTYNADVKSYPSRLAHYLIGKQQYAAALTRYNNAVAHHQHPLPKRLPLPTAPVHPQLSLASFSLPILYSCLSLAYLYLAYRARQRQDGKLIVAAR